jgi:hypothetical protein
MMPSPRAARCFTLPAVGAAALILAACADTFTVEAPQPPQLVGEITAATSAPGLECGPLRAEVSLIGDRITGRAFKGRDASGPFDRAIGRLEPWWIEGDVYENGVAVITLFQSTIVPVGPVDSVGAKPFSVFRGTLVGTRLDALEQPPFCGRRLVAEPPPVG